MNSSTDKDLKRIMGAIRCDTLEEKAKKKERAEAIEYNVPIVMDSLVGSIESDMGIKAT